ncbi:MAG: PqqD family protein [Pyrinomonadaceae bacterium]|nr:PqqD family protein [Pyrinomonadaceae bacterium]
MEKPKARKENIVVQKLDDETLVYDLTENKAYCLNETSALVWELCDGHRTALEISDQMSKKLKNLISEDFVRLALDQLSRDGLLEEPRSDFFEGTSRREVIKKVGFASIVALPVVSSLIAPEAAVAQSCLTGSFSGCGSPCCPGLTCFAGNHCCVPGVTLANAPGFTGCQNIGTCGGNFANNCCSGSATDLGANAACFPTQVLCQCDPMP